MRADCGRLCEAMPELPRIKTIAAVGAYDGQIGGIGTDSRRLTGIMSYLLQSGVAIDPSFEIDVINFRERRNFLDEDKKADLLFIAFILACSKNTIPYHTGLNKEARYHDYRSVFGLALSPKHTPDTWRERILACDAKMIATFGGVSEIGTHILCEDKEESGLRALIDTPKFSLHNRAVMESINPKYGGYVLKTKTSLATLYNNAANDLPLPWLGFAGTPAYIKAAGPFLSEETTLGRNARAMALTL